MDGSHDTITRLGRRRVLRRALALGLGAASGLLVDGLGGGTAGAAPAAPPPHPGAPPDKANASGVTVSPQDPAISAGPVEYPGVLTSMQGYLSTPAGGEVYPGILVLHDVAGLTEHVRDLTRRLAKTGYVALAPDLLSRHGGTAKLGSAAAVEAAIQDTPSSEFLNEMTASVRYLEARPLAAKTRIGALGFGFGGSLEWFLLSQDPDVKAAVIFSAETPRPEIAAHITAAVLAIFGENDKNSTADLKAFDAVMQKAGVTWQYKLEPKADRGFFDDSHSRYVAAAAQDAWHLTLDWFAKYLSA